MKNFKIYLTNNEQINIKCDDCIYNDKTDEVEIIIDNEIALLLKPKTIGIHKISQETSLATGFINPIIKRS